MPLAVWVNRATPSIWVLDRAGRTDCDVQVDGGSVSGQLAWRRRTWRGGSAMGIRKSGLSFETPFE